MSKRIKILLKSLVTLGLLGFLFYEMDLRLFWGVLKSASWTLVALAILLHLVTALFSVERWRVILRNFDMNPGFDVLMRITLIGYFFNVFLPSAIGGDFFRAFYLARREGRGLSTTLTTMFLDRSAGLLALLVIGTAACIVHPVEVEGYPLLPLFIVLIVVFVVAIGLLFNRATHRWLRRLLERFKRTDIEKKMELLTEGLERLRRNPKAILSAMALSFLLQILVVLMMWVAALAIGIRAPFYVYMIFIPIINLAVTIPVTINGVGLRESVYYLLFAQVGVSVETAVTLSLLNFVAVLGTALPGAVVYSLYKKDEGFDKALIDQGVNE